MAGLFDGRIVGKGFRQREVAETSLPPDHHAPRRVVIENILGFAEIAGEQLAQPVFLDRRGETEQCGEFVAAAFLDLAHLGGHEEARFLYGAFPGEHPAPVADELAAQGAFIETPGELVGKPHQHASGG